VASWGTNLDCSQMHGSSTKTGKANKKGEGISLIVLVPYRHMEEAICNTLSDLLILRRQTSPQLAEECIPKFCIDHADTLVRGKFSQD